MPVVRFAAILPKQLDTKAAYAVLEDQMRQFAELKPKSMIEDTWASWTGSTPEAILDISSTAKSITATIYITGDKHGVEKWEWLNEGTPPHVIAPRYAQRLSYPGVFKAKTKPASGKESYYSSESGGKSGAYEYRNIVQHPGIEPRDWTGNIARKIGKDWEDWMNNAMGQAAAATGHGMGKTAKISRGGGIGKFLGKVSKSFKRGVQVIQEI